MDNGPDGLWIDEQAKTVLSIELKTDKVSKLNKDDTGQSHDNVQWVSDEYKNYNHIGHLFICDTSEVTLSANPGPRWFCSNGDRLKALVTSFNAEVMKVRLLPKEDRLRAIETFNNRGEWTLEGVLAQLAISEITK